MNFEVAPTESVTRREFLAVILAGFGNELLPLTGDHGDEPCPKALLSVADKPMLDFPLSWLEQSGIEDVLLICPSSHKHAISHYVQSSSASFTSLNIDIQTYDESQEMSTGTCSILRHFSSRIQEDFVIMPCDFIPPPSLPLSTILNKFRTDAMSDGSIATTCWFENSKLDKGAFPEEWGPPPTPTTIVWDDTSGTLLYVDTLDDQDRNGQDFELRMSLLTRYPRARLSKKLQDSHVYVCKRSVLDVLQQKRHLDSLKEDFFPWLCKVQYQATKRGKYGHTLGVVSNSASHSMSMKHSTLYTDVPKARAFLDVRSHASSPAPQSEIGLSQPPSPTGSDDDESITVSLRIGLHVHRADSGYAVRTNNLQAYLEANRRFLSETSYVLPSDPTKRSLIDHKAAISADSAVGDFTRVEERASIKKSVIGKHCVIGKMAKIVGCVLLDHCVISDGARLEGCLLGGNTKVGTKSELKGCVTQAGYEVEEHANYRNEKLDVSDWNEGHQRSEDSEEEGEDDGDEEDDD
ncbi:UDP-3-O-glucosamine N-acyltransferase [Coniophora puteana RWD-64-598 SS2]|uniref:Translation initiation factor eIF2B subunit gamma n=1 Tax=Coniophora puteana (strain RWD-64-598) TaxID=741705 RepID=A0A5M3MUT9_CONPW|nr:UDP-3-O-glucosamine N-acyltransferase [Coniophora puteana RWD-64-598 SS2]EIW82942.1 UDP-3-O-glucosamine N-acyltransferase [Coniophora puteana RWD-64-598 SS2]